jgi:hypothetical protein
MIRKPSIKKSIAARTTGRATRSFRRLTNPFYGKAGMGWLKNPAKAARGKIYRKTTVSAKGLTGCLTACIYYPLYWTFLLMFWMLKICFMAMIFLLVGGVNLLIWLTELIYNAIADAIYAKRQQAVSEVIEE